MAKEPRTPSLTVFLDPEYAKDKEKAMLIQRKLEYTTLSDLVSKVRTHAPPSGPGGVAVCDSIALTHPGLQMEIHYDPQMKVSVVEEDQEVLDNFYDLEDEVRALTPWTALQYDGPNHLGLWCNAAAWASNGPNHLGFVRALQDEDELALKLSPWLLRIQLNLVTMREKKLEADEIVNRLTSTSDGGLGLDEHLECIASPANYDPPTVRIRVKRNPEDDKAGEEDEDDMQTYLKVRQQPFFFAAAFSSLPWQLLCGA